MFLGNADIKKALGLCLLECIQSCARRHGRGDGAYADIALCHFQQLTDRNFTIDNMGIPFALSGFNKERSYAMELIRMRLGRLISLALLRDDMNKKRFISLF